MEETTGLATKETVIVPIAENGNHLLVPTKSLPIAKLVSNENLIAEERFLIEKETEVERNYQGWRGYRRLFQISQTLGKLGLYLYLDQYDVHRAQHLKQAEARIETARRLTRTAVIGEWLYGLRLGSFHWTMLVLRRFFLGAEKNKELNHEKQAVWLKE
jgi:hypothetical protein